MPEDASGDGTDTRDGRAADSESATGLDNDQDEDSASTAEWGDDPGADSEPTPEWTDDRDRDPGADSEPTWEPEQAGDTQAERERIPLDLSSPESESDPDRESDETSDDADEYAPEPSSAPIEAGDPDLEHAIFVLLGAIAMLLVVARLLALPLG